MATWFCQQGCREDPSWVLRCVLIHMHPESPPCCSVVSLEEVTWDFRGHHSWDTWGGVKACPLWWMALGQHWLV